MFENMQERPFPRGALLGATGLVFAALVAATLASLFDVGATRFKPGDVVEQRELLFADASNGSVEVQDAGTGRVVDVLPPGSSGFVRVVLHGLARERGLAGIGPAIPFKLSRFADGTTVLEDMATGRFVSLGAFGHENARSFEPLLQKGR